MDENMTGVNVQEVAAPAETAVAAESVHQQFPQGRRPPARLRLSCFRPCFFAPLDFYAFLRIYD